MLFTFWSLSISETLVWTLIGFKYFFLLGRSVQEKFRCSEDLHNIRPCSCNERFVTNDVVLVFVGDVGGYMYDVSVLVDQVSSFFSILLPHFEVFDGTTRPVSSSACLLRNKRIL